MPYIGYPFHLPVIPAQAGMTELEVTFQYRQDHLETVLAHMQMTRAKVWGLGRDVGPQANGEGTMRGGPW